MIRAILSIELSTSLSSVALWSDGEILGHIEWVTGRDHSSLFRHLDDILHTLKCSRKDSSMTIDLIIVGSGPGSYGGVRVALAAADGLALAWQAQMVALCSWEALLPPSPLPIDVIADARRQSWVTARLCNGHVGGFTIVSTQDMPLWLEQRTADHILVYSPQAAGTVYELGACIKHETYPKALLLIDLWLAKTPSEQQQLLNTQPAPIYIRDPHITKSKK